MRYKANLKKITQKERFVEITQDFVFLYRTDENGYIWEIEYLNKKNNNPIYDSFPAIGHNKNQYNFGRVFQHSEFNDNNKKVLKTIFSFL